jgi:hypothetical protein
MGSNLECGRARSQIKAQQYAQEQVSVWEVVKHGFVYGSQSFIAAEAIKNRCQ